MSDSSRRTVAAGTFSRRTLLVATLAGTVVVAVGCTAETGDTADAVTEAQIDQLAAQFDVQTALVAAFDRAFAAFPELAAAAAEQADQARQQLERLRAAAPGVGSTSSAATSSDAISPAAPPLDPAGALGYLRTEASRAADAHATACPGFSGARAALLGSIAAGLRGQDGQLA
ncbi:hypothetical protein SAMN05661080_04151 [Modestobacter sp. DSM 44400]|uniref:hypothetical protein n=1 Tax=Modestobacter sp. DSM 44400 TaxID=1550230 RepID=UPI000898B484|nr:hypothetical protein [Modestobacter sp. DSM 44400]SDY64674.1 hypothetical protein SAMN05661080_04151 [Modestobacter sp. DSM 44400]